MDKLERDHLLLAARLQRAYVEAQHCLLARIEAATAGRGNWPDLAEYQTVAALGRLAGTEMRHYLGAVKTLRRRSRIGRIQRESANERTWQPGPELWLKQQDSA